MIFFSGILFRILLYQNTLSVGDYYEGGIVFYIDDTGKHGLISAEMDQTWFEDGKRIVQAKWGCHVTRLIGADESGVGSGLKNTEDIEKGCDTENTAADVCWNLRINGFDDWFLPSRDELNLMYKNLHKKGLAKFAAGAYWSSTESSTFAAWSQNFGGGAQNVIDKGNVAYVRAIREF